MPKKSATTPSKRGRPTAYRQEYSAQAYKLCLLGATDADLAGFFGVQETTINNWKTAHPEFLESLKDGKQHADARVAESLYRRAVGYEHDAVKIVADAKTGAEHVVPYVERYPPDTTAAIFWLKNRKPDRWRDKQETTTYDFNPDDFTDEGLDRVADGEDPMHVLATGGRLKPDARDPA